jgi:DNA repair photolyase
MSDSVDTPMISRRHDAAATIERNHFKYKSLSSWALNLFMGCSHACRFCYVTETSTNKQANLLRSFGVSDPVKDWGNYVLVRPWDQKKFLASLRKAEKTPISNLNADGNRAVFLCSTTDPYQVIRNPDPEKQKSLNENARTTLRNSLEAIRDHSTLNVRILTRSPLARQDFDIFKTFGDRLLLGTSLPTLDPILARLYEPKVPAPSQRLKLLTDANAAGIHTYVAVAPVFPEVGYSGILDVFKAVKAAKPHTIFLEPVNIRLGIAERIQLEAKKLGREIDMDPYRNPVAWVKYAIKTLEDAERAATETGQFSRLHLWPDFEALGSKRAISMQEDPDAYLKWLQSYWDRISEWPGKKPSK